MRAKRGLLACFALTALLGCGGDVSVALCFGDPQFCSQAFLPVANAGPDQTVSSGSVVTLDGSASEGDIDSYSWAQTGGPAVSLNGASSAVATFIAPFVASAVTLSFQLTVVSGANQADTDSTSVIVQP
ncbi:MAG: PKD domain-containing protein [Betaproteobacteria bacterium]